MVRIEGQRRQISPQEDAYSRGASYSRSQQAGIETYGGEIPLLLLRSIWTLAKFDQNEDQDRPSATSGG